MKKSLFLFSILLPFLFGGAVLAADPKQNVQALNDDESETDLNNLMLRAKQGDSIAQFELGLMYSQGRGVPRDSKIEAKWFALAAKQGHAHAQYNLGLMYGLGKGVSQNFIRAHTWLNIAASNNAEHASQNRDLVAQLMSPADIAEAEKLARECLKNNYKGC